MKYQLTFLLSLLSLISFAQVGIGTLDPQAELDLNSAITTTYLIDINFNDDHDGVTTSGSPAWSVQSYQDSICFSSNNTIATQITEVIITVVVPDAKVAYLSFDIYIDLTTAGLLDLSKTVLTSVDNTDWTKMVIPLNPGLNKYIITFSGDGSFDLPGKVAIDNVKSYYQDGYALRIEDLNQETGHVLTSDEFGNATWMENLPGIVVDNDGDTYVDALDENLIIKQVEGNQVYFQSKDSLNIIADRIILGTTSNQNISSATGAMAWGALNESSGSLSTSWGTFSKASGTKSTAWGDNSTASGQQATAWGQGNTAAGINSTAFGAGTVADTLNAVAMGENTVASGVNSVAMGIQTYAIGENAMTWGGRDINPTDSVIASGPISTAWGYKTKASGNASTSFGWNNEAQGFASAAWGQDNLASGTRSTAWGASNQANEKLSTAWGAGNLTLGESSTAWGFGNVASGRRSTTWGEYNTAAGFNSTAFGEETVADTTNAVAMGKNTVASGVNSVAMGIQTYALGENAMTWGGRNINPTDSVIASGYASTAWGEGTKASGKASTAWGENNSVSGKYSTSWGHGNNVSSIYATSLGYYSRSLTGVPSVAIPSDPLFQIGNGSSFSRNDALIILKNGNVGIDFGETDGSPQYSLHVLGQIVGDNVAASSDSRIKKNQNSLEYGLNEVLRLVPKTYDQFAYSFPNNNLKLKGTGTPSIGLIAQEVYELVPEAVLVPEDENSNIWHLDYTKLIPVLINAVKELNAENEELKEKLKKLEDLEARINALEGMD